jgi:hypothetical protein
LLFGADLGFHAEWLRDEPYEATTTGSKAISIDWCQLSPGDGEHEIRGAEFGISLPLFPFTGKRGFVF